MSSELSLKTTVELNNGLKMPVFGLGTWRSDKGKVATAVEAALKHGYIHVDCALVYQNQEEVAEGLKAALDSGVKREDIWITSKIWNNFQHPSAVRGAVERINRELGVEYTDLILIHWPTPFKHGGDLFPGNGNTLPSGDYVIETDEETTFAQTWAALEACVDAGLCKSIGVSNFNTAQVDEILASARIKPVTNQVECHPYLNQTQLRADMAARGIVVTAYSPLGNVNPEVFPSCLDDEALAAIGRKHGKSAAQVMIRWSMQVGNIVIPKTVTPSRVVENANVFDFALDSTDMEQIAALGLRNVRMVNPRFYKDGKQVFE